MGSQIVFGSIGFYDLSVSANLGFGRETLTSEKVEITGSLAGIILDVELDPETVLEEAPEALTYFVSTKYFDPNQEFESVLLEYAYIYDSETPMPERYDPNELYYEAVLIESSEATTILENISNYNSKIHLRLTVYLLGSETPIVLDEYEFTTPFRFLGSLYVQDVGAEYALFSVYIEGNFDLEISVWVDVYHLDHLLTSISVNLDDEDSQYSEITARVDHLMPNTPHSAVLRCEYIDPVTLEEKKVDIPEVTFATSQMYYWELTTFIDNGSYFDVVVTTNDPFNIIESVTCYITGMDESGVYVNSYYYSLQPQTIENMVVYSGTIDKPLEPHYDLELSLNKIINQSYYSEIIHTHSV